MREARTSQARKFRGRRRGERRCFRVAAVLQSRRRRPAVPPPPTCRRQLARRPSPILVRVRRPFYRRAALRPCPLLDRRPSTPSLLEAAVRPAAAVSRSRQTFQGDVPRSLPFCRAVAAVPAQRARRPSPASSPPQPPPQVRSGSTPIRPRRQPPAIGPPFRADD